MIRDPAIQPGFLHIPTEPPMPTKPKATTKPRGPGRPRLPAGKRSRAVNTTLPAAVADWLATLDPSANGSASAGLRAVAVAEYEKKTCKENREIALQ